MFGNLFKEAEAVAGRSSNLQARIDRLAIRVTQLDSTVEEGLFLIIGFESWFWIIQWQIFTCFLKPNAPKKLTNKDTI